MKQLALPDLKAADLRQIREEIIVYSKGLTEESETSPLPMILNLFPDKSFRLGTEQDEEALSLLLVLKKSLPALPSSEQVKIANQLLAQGLCIFVPRKTDSDHIYFWALRDGIPIPFLLGKEKAAASEALRNSQKWSVFLAALLAAGILIMVSLALLPPAPVIP